MTESNTDKSPQTHPHLAIIGGGTMARAIYGGAVAAGVLDPSRDNARRVFLASLVYLPIVLAVTVLDRP